MQIQEIMLGCGGSSKECKRGYVVEYNTLGARAEYG